MLWLALPALVAVLILAPAPQQAHADPGDILLASANQSGAYANDACNNADVSDDGRYVVFNSRATNLDTPGVVDTQVFRKDTWTGQMELVSCDAGGTQGNASSIVPAISSDGRYVAFKTKATNLVPIPAGIDQIVRKDMETGQVALCSANASGTPGDSDSNTPAITPDGRYVVFWGDATNLVPGSTLNQVFRKDMATGEVKLVSCDAGNMQGNGTSRDVSVSDSGRYVSFASQATNLIPGGTSGTQAFRKDLQTGEVKLCSSDAMGDEGDNASSVTVISPDGTYVAFESNSTDLVPGGTFGWEVYRKNVGTGEIVLCSADASGTESDANSFYPSMSSDGRFVAFYSYAGNLVPGGTTNVQVFRKDLESKEVALVSSDAAGQQGNGTNSVPTITPDGRYVVFESFSTNFVAPVTSGEQVFRKELQAPTSFYFAEGYTGAGFQEYLCLGNPVNAPLEITVTYLFSGQPSVDKTYTVPGNSRYTANVNAEVGPDRQVSIRCSAEYPFVAERPMYFDYTGGGASWTGGHDVVGTSMPSTAWYFAEGYTGAGFDEWICVLNPASSDASLTFRFQTQEEGEKVVEGFSVPAASRLSFKANDLLGGGSYQTSLKLESSLPVVAERPMYFNYSGTGGWNWTGGHCVMGASSLVRSYYFAEGTTRAGFEEWITLQNPGAADINVHATYQLGVGAPIEMDYPVPAAKRSTIYVPTQVGADRDVSVRLTSTSPFLAERPMYFDYQGMGAWGWTGGHCVIGASGDALDWFFAEGYTGDGFEEWLCIQNPGTKDADVVILYYPEGGTPVVKAPFKVAANSRYTVPVNLDAGEGQSISAWVTANEPVIVERPMYFNFNGMYTGGHDVVGFTP